MPKCHNPTGCLEETKNDELRPTNAKEVHFYLLDDGFLSSYNDRTRDNYTSPVNVTLLARLARGDHILAVASVSRFASLVSFPNVIYHLTFNHDPLCHFRRIKVTAVLRRLLQLPLVSLHIDMHVHLAM